MSYSNGLEETYRKSVPKSDNNITQTDIYLKKLDEVDISEGEE